MKIMKERTHIKEILQKYGWATEKSLHSTAVSNWINLLLLLLTASKQDYTLSTLYYVYTLIESTQHVTRPLIILQCEGGWAKRQVSFSRSQRCLMNSRQTSTDRSGWSEKLIAITSLSQTIHKWYKSSAIILQVLSRHNIDYWQKGDTRSEIAWRDQTTRFGVCLQKTTV